MTLALDTRLFPDPLVRAIDRLRLGYGTRATDLRHGEVVAVRKGAGIDFCDHRQYLPGDDLRVVDWNAYQRSRDLLVRMFDEMRTLPVYVLLDCSASMGFGPMPASTVARQAAALLCGAAMRDHNTPVVLPFAESALPALRPTGGTSGSVLSVLQQLGALPMGGASDLHAAFARLRNLKGPAGLAILISDLFDPSGPKRLEPVLRRMSHRLVIVQITRATDAEPSVTGEARIEDCETGRTVDLWVTPETRNRYRKAYQEFTREWRDVASRRRAPLVTLDAEVPILGQLSGLMRAGLLRAC
jgi:uncharacterized protein (DUF58 family)